MIILGIDPGTATTGWGVVRFTKRGKQTGSNLKLIDFGCILTDSKDEMGDRLLVLKRALKKVIKLYQPNCVVIEKLFFGSNSTSALSVGQARGVVMLVAREGRMPISEYTGLEVKLAVADHGRADKKTIQTAVRRHLRIKKLPNVKDQIGKGIFRFRDDAYDAVATAICHVLKAAGSEQLKENGSK